MINVNDTNSALFVTKGKSFYSYDPPYTSYSPVICRAIYNERSDVSSYRFISPKYNPVHRPFDIEYGSSNMLNIDHQMYAYTDDKYYDSRRTLSNSYYCIDSTVKFTSGQSLNISAYNDRNFLNIEESKFPWTYHSQGTSYLRFDVEQIFELVTNNKITKSNKFDGLSDARSGDYSTFIVSAKDLYYDGPEMPTQLGCAILFSATHVPEQFCVGFKGGTGGSLYNFIGKIYNNGSHLKSLGNNYYLFYDEIVDNIPFRQFVNSSFCHLEWTGFYQGTDIGMQLTPPVVLSAPKWSIIDTGASVTPSEQVSDHLFTDFGFVSVKTYLQFGTPGKYASIVLNENPDVLVTKQKDVTSPGIIARYASKALQHRRLANGNSTWEFFHSTEPFSAHPNYGYAGFYATDAVTDIIKWGDVKYIDQLNGALNVTSLSSIPDEWGTWDSLTGLEATFQKTGLTKIPESWSGLGNVKSMLSTFESAHDLSAIPNSWSGLDSLQNTYKMFKDCYKLSSTPTDLFEECPNLINMSQMFMNCSALTSDIGPILDYITSHFYTSAASVYGSAFMGCTGVKSGTNDYQAIINDQTPVAGTTKANGYYKYLFGLA